MTDMPNPPDSPTVARPKQTWTMLPDIPDGENHKPDFEQMQLQYMRQHFPKLWDALEEGEYYGSPWPPGADEDDGGEG